MVKGDFDNLFFVKFFLYIIIILFNRLYKFVLITLVNNLISSSSIYICPHKNKKFETTFIVLSNHRDFHCRHSLAVTTNTFLLAVSSIVVFCKSFAY